MAPHASRTSNIQFSTCVKLQHNNMDILELGMLQKGKKQLPQTSFFLPMGRVLPSMTKQTSLNQTIERDSLYNGCLLPLNRREPRKCTPTMSRCLPVSPYDVFGGATETARAGAQHSSQKKLKISEEEKGWKMVGT